MPIQKRLDKNGKARYTAVVCNKYTGRRETVGTFSRRCDALTKLEEAKRRIRLGDDNFERKDKAFDKLVEQWLETLTLRPSTVEDYRTTSRHLVAFFRNRAVSSIKKEDVRQFVASAVKQGFKPQYVRKMATRLTQIYNYAIDCGYATRSPTAGGIPNLPRVERKQVRPLTPEQLRALVAAAPDYWSAFLLVLAGCGLRIGEAFGLTIENLDLEGGTLKVTHQLSRGELVAPKTSAAVRTVPLPPTVVDALRQHIEVVPPNEMGLVFPTENGYPVTAGNWYRRVWRPTVKRSGLRQDLRAHDLRKTFASALVRHGRSVAYFQSVLGHASAQTSLTWYVGVYADEGEVAVRDMEDWLSREEPAQRTLRIAEPMSRECNETATHARSAA